MSDKIKSRHSARSRAPIDEDGAKWWDMYGDHQENTTEIRTHLESNIAGEKNRLLKSVADKATTTNNDDIERKLTSNVFNKVVKIESKLEDNVSRADSIDKVVKKWREDQARLRYEQAKLALIKSLKVKFGEQTTDTLEHDKNVMKKFPQIIITQDIEGTSKVSRENVSCWIFMFICMMFKVHICSGGKFRSRS